MHNSFGTPFGFPFFGGSSSASIAPYTFPVALGEFPYQLDYTHDFLLEPVPTLREQSDSSDNPGEQSLNPAALWRRSGESWHLGAGQRFFDRKQISSPFRFRESLGLNPWEKWELSLHQETERKLASANTNLLFAIAGTHFYTLDGTALKFTQDITPASPSFTAVTGGTAGTGLSIASDGFNVLVAYGTAGIDKTTRGAATKANHTADDVSLLGFARGRWLAAQNNIVYDITVLATGGAGSLPTALFTQPNTDFKWKAFAEGRNHVFMAGYSGDKSLIYRATIKSDGTGLDVPVVAGELPDGELVESLYGYLGPFMLIGIGGEPGWRFALIDEQGDLTLGARIETPLPVLCFEGQGKFVWFGYGNYDSTHSGLGRLTPGQFGNPEELTPAYASDLMATGENAQVLSVATFQGQRVFSVSADGIWSDAANGFLVPSGTLDTGEILFNMNEEKLGLYLDYTVTPHDVGTHSAYVSADSEAFVFLGEHVAHHEPFALGELAARHFEIRLKLTRDADDETLAQKLLSWLLRVQPVPSVTNTISVPFLITDPVYDNDGYPHSVDTWATLRNIVDLNKGKTVTKLVIGEVSFICVVENYSFKFERLLEDAQGVLGINGTCEVILKITTEELF